MADVKITALAPISANPVNPATFPIPMVDLLDNSMAASGTTKKVTVNQILGAGGTATLASATITGDLTVRTTGLTVNSSGVGVGTSSQSSFLGNSPKKLVIGDGTQTPALTLYGGSANVSGIYYAKGTVGNQTYRGFFEYDHSVDALAFGIAGSTAMTLNSTGLGVGVVPSAGKGALQLSSGINFPATQVASSDANTLDDYEEGTFTATLTGGTSNPTTPVTTTARYTKVGRLVTVQIEFVNISNAGASGAIAITGLPFVNGSVAATGIATLYNLATFTGSPVVYLDTGASFLAFYGNVSSSAFSSVTHNSTTSGYSTTTITYSV